MENLALIDSFSEFKDDKLIDRVTLMVILEDVFTETGELYVVKPVIDYKKLHSLGVTVSDGTKTSAVENVTGKTKSVF